MLCVLLSNPSVHVIVLIRVSARDLSRRPTRFSISSCRTEINALSPPPFFSRFLAIESIPRKIAYSVHLRSHTRHMIAFHAHRISRFPMSKITLTAKFDVNSNSAKFLYLRKRTTNAKPFFLCNRGAPHRPKMEAVPSRDYFRVGERCDGRRVSIERSSR